MICGLKKAIIILLFVVLVGLVYLFYMDKINLTKYQTTVDYGSLNAEQIKAMDMILLCGESGATSIEQNLSASEFDEVIDCIGLYFGANLAHQNVALWRPGYAEVNPDLLRTLEQDKVVLDAKIDRIVSSMYEGTDRFKLLQISNYIAKTMQYSYSLDDIEPLSGLAGKGSCMTYSMLFYKMAKRIGIQTYICQGIVDNGEMVALHAWNLFVLDGEQYFYDLTWYDSTKDPRYIHSDTPWGRSFGFSWRDSAEQKRNLGGTNGEENIY